MVILSSLVLASCSSTQSLAEYFADSAENPNFLKFDLPSSILNIKSGDLTEDQFNAFKSLKKLNILAFKKNESNTADYEIEHLKIKRILKGKDFVELMKVKTSLGKATIKYLGTEDAIDELIVYGNNKEMGFIVVRVLGDNMKPSNMMQLLGALEKSDFKGEGLEKLVDWIDN